MARGKIEYEGLRWPVVILTVVALYVGSAMLSSKISHFFNPKIAYHSIFKPSQKKEIDKSEKALQPIVLEQKITEKTIPTQTSKQTSQQYVGQSKQKQKRDISKLPKPQKHGGFLTSVAMNYKNTYNLSNLVDVPLYITTLSSSGETLSVDTVSHSVSLDTTIIKENTIEKLLKSGEKVTIKQEYNHTIR